MKESEYWKVFQEVSEDNVGNNPLLLNILEKKVVRNVKRSYHRVLNSGIEREWLSGESILLLSRRHGIPPVLLGKMIRKKIGSSPRLEKEMQEAEERDLFYSSSAVRRARSNGRMVENAVADWLSRRGVRFLRGDELEGKLRPDFLFPEPVRIHGSVLNWLECKYYFGSPEDMRRDWKGQLEKYRRAFGPGGIVYWLGFVQDAVPGEEHAVFSGEVFRQSS